MTFQIQDIILHQITATESTGYQLQLREQAMPSNTLHEHLLSELVKVHQQRSKTYAHFEVNEVSSVIQTELQQYLNGEQAFLNWSKSMMQQLILLLNTDEYPFMTASVVVFCRYRHLATDYLLVAFIESQQSTRITDNLEIQGTQYLNVAQSDKIMVLDMTQWRTSPDLARYFALSTGRVGRRVADFFIQWWQLLEGVNAKQQTNELIKAVNHYCLHNELSEQESRECKQQVYDYCEAQTALEEDVVIQNLSQHLTQQSSKQVDAPFKEFVQQQGIQLESQFPAAKNVLKQLKIYKGSAKGISVRFEADLLGEQVIWDSINDQLIIQGLPSSLRKQLLEQKPLSESEAISLDDL